MGAAELAGALSCVLLVHITGKRPLVFTSLIGTSICFFATATYARYLHLVPGVTVDNIVANASIPDLHRSNVYSTQNITDVIDFIGTSNDPITTTTPYDFYSTTTYSESIEGGTLQPTTDRFKRKSADALITNSTDSLIASGINKIFLPIPNAEENKYSWLPLTFIITGAYFAHIGIRCIPWMLIGEVFPVNVRSASSGLSSGTGYICAFLSNFLFLPMLEWLTLSGTFWLYSAVAIVGCVILYFCLPETEGRTLIDIEEHFIGRKLLSDKTKRITMNNNNNNNMPNVPNDCSHQIKSNNNNQSNGFDLAGVMSSIPIEKLASNEPRLSVPEIQIIKSERSPNAGSKRYKHRVSDILQSRNSLASNTSSDDVVQDTHL